MTVAEQLKIHEAGKGPIGTRVAEQTQPHRRKIVIISAGWGSSGYYSEGVLARDGAVVFPSGTHMYMNHPSATEEVDQPERRVEDLAATLVTTPHMEGIDLVAEAEVKPHWEPVVDAVAKDIGVSIRAIGEMEHGSAAGKEGPIITALVEGISVDFVTQAGRGGKVGELIESARAVNIREAGQVEEARNVAEWLEAFIHKTFTARADEGFGEGFITRDERLMLSAAIGEALDAFHSSVQHNAAQLFKRDPFDEPEDPAAGLEESWQNQGDSSPGKQEVAMSDEEKLSRLEEDVRQHEGRISEVEQERDTAKTEAEEATKRAERAEDRLLTQEAEKVIAEAFAEIEAEAKEKGEGLLPERASKRVAKESLGEKLPTDEDGKLDRDRLTERVRKAAKEEREYLVGDENENGGGAVTGLPARESATAATTAASEDESEAKLIERFQSQGMSEEAAKTAARGR